MTKSFESYLLSQFEQSKYLIFKSWLEDQDYSGIILYAEQWAKESATVKALDVQWPEKADEDRNAGWEDSMNMGDANSAGYDSGWNNAIDTCIEAYKKINNPPPIEPAKARKALDCLTQKDEEIAKLKGALLEINMSAQEDIDSGMNTDQHWLVDTCAKALKETQGKDG